MSSSPLSLKHLFSLGTEDWSEKMVAGLDAEGRASSPKAAVMKQVPVIMRWMDLRGELVSRVGEILDFDITDTLIGVWNKYNLLREYRDSKKHPPEETAFVNLMQHTITSKHHPSIEIEKNQQRIAKLDFLLNFSLTVDAVVLRVQAGRIKGIQLGDMKGDVTLRYHDLEILNKSLPRITVPGAIDLGEGIAIPAPAARAAP
jgi:hypothetical protein